MANNVVIDNLREWLRVNKHLAKQIAKELENE